VPTCTRGAQGEVAALLVAHARGGRGARGPRPEEEYRWGKKRSEKKKGEKGKEKEEKKKEKEKRKIREEK
jgi:hypothetical protein